MVWEAAVMLTLASKLKRDDGVRGPRASNPASDSTRRVSVRDKLLVKEVADLEANLPCTCKVNFPDPNKLHYFQLTVTPDEGYYQGGKFQFETEVPDAYNMVPPKVKCLTRIWHPNITETGEICLSLLREHSIDGTGWAPTRTLKDIVWGLNSLFTDLLNFDDPLNIEAAEHHLRDKISLEVVYVVCSKLMKTCAKSSSVSFQRQRFYSELFHVAYIYKARKNLEWKLLVFFFNDPNFHACIIVLLALTPNIGAKHAVKIAEEVIEVKGLKLLFLPCELLILKAYRKSDIFICKLDFSFSTPPHDFGIILIIFESMLVLKLAWSHPCCACQVSSRLGSVSVLGLEDFRSKVEDYIKRYAR
ncbi:hypothetical protein IHE44_0014225 [Lamprotornis superbus]|uniref:E2 NEDD8-conjugating enzyme n=66 Tax=Passeriformes TaxID=9126 RepID=A0A835TQI7_9PASS|nr:hypothetical protein IHE44_0014225 [Lamprotornis superbus]